MSSTASPGEAASGFQQALLALCQDPAMWRLAVRRAGSSDLAQDALQETFYAIARVRDPQRIENLPAFFRTALIHEIDHQRWQLRPLPADPEMLAGYRQQDLSWRDPLPRAVDSQAVLAVLAEAWLLRLRREREQLAATVPGRSRCPRCYRDAMVAAAEAILRATVAGNVSRADSNEALQAAQPDWFDESGCPGQTLYQRLSRGRADLRILLKIVVSRQDLSP